MDQSEVRKSLAQHSKGIVNGVCLFAACSFMLPTAANANIVDNTYGAGAGSFELGLFVNGGGNPISHGPDYMGLLPGDNTTITGWTVGGPGDGVDWLTTPGWGADTGIHSVDLQHLSASSISTTIPTLAGNIYNLSFSAAAVSGYTNTGDVSAGSLINQAFAPSFSGSFYNQTYTPYSFTFTATGSTTLITFQATGLSTTYGPVIDSVSVLSVPEPEEWAMMLLGFGMVGYQIKRKQMKAAPAAA